MWNIWQWARRAITSTLSRPDPWLKEVLAGEATYSGQPVNEETALRYTAVFACVRVLSETVASLPLHLYRREGEARARAATHSLYDVLHSRPNPYQTSYEWRLLCMTHLLLWGNAYSEVERDQAGTITALWPLRPDRVILLADESGQPFYQYLPTRGPKVNLSWDRVLHLRGLSTDGWLGLSPIQAARQSIGLSLAAERFGAAFFGKGSRVGGILKTSQNLGPDAKRELRKAFEEGHVGPEAFHRVAILTGDMTFEPLKLSNEDAQFIETRRLGVEDIARIYRVPPHMIADLSKANYSNVDAQNRQFATYSVMPWTTNIEEAISAKLLGPRQRQVYFAEHDMAGLLRGDHESRFRAYQSAIYSGWLSPNDVRKFENLPPRPDGDLYLQPTNLVVSPFFPPQQQGGNNND